MKPEILDKIEAKWPHLAAMVRNYRATGDTRIRNGIVDAVLLAEVAYLTPSEIIYLATLKAASSTSVRKAASSAENGKKGGRPPKRKEP